MIGAARSLELLQDTLAVEEQALFLLPRGHLLGRKPFSFGGGDGGGVGLLLLD